MEKPLFEDLKPVLPEKPEDSAFLLVIPEDFNYEAACKSVQERINKNRCEVNVELVAAVKGALWLPVEPVDKSATIVILNAIEESKRLCGYPDPDLIFKLLQQRRKALKAQIEDSPTDPGIK